MTPRPFRLFAAACVLAGFATPRAAAEFVTLQYDRAAGNPSITSNLYSNAPAGPFYWHENNLPPNTSFPPPTATFCIELNQGPPAQILPQAGDNVIFKVETAAQDLGTAKANAITELYGLHYSAAWGSASFKGDAASTAFQIALWELVYDGANAADKTSLDHGAFYIPGATFAQKQTAQSWLNSLTGNTASFGTNSATKGMELVALLAPGGTGAKSQDQIQDQITLRPASAVPAPPAVVLFGLGLVGLIGRSRFRRSTAA